jgi:hypothetical protein
MKVLPSQAASHGILRRLGVMKILPSPTLAGVREFAVLSSGKPSGKRYKVIRESVID